MKVRVSNGGGVSVNIQKKPQILVNQAGLTTRSLGDLTDVNLSTKEDGSLLIYDEQTEQFIASTLLEKQTVNGGHF
jgi:hypothetical protein